MILYYLAAKKFSILNWRRDFCDWSISSHSIWKVMLSRHLTEYSTLEGIMLYRRSLNTDQLTETVVRRRASSIMFIVMCYTPVCDVIIVFIFECCALLRLLLS